MLRRESFPPIDNDQYNKLPASGSNKMGITEQAADRALYSQTVRNTSGPEMPSFGAIQLLRKWDHETILMWTKVTIRTGGHPAVWKPASGVVIPKPSREDDPKLQDNCYISLF
jgi:hypothetical protein